MLKSLRYTRAVHARLQPLLQNVSHKRSNLLTGLGRRWNAATALAEESDSLLVQSAVSRYNEIGVQQLPLYVHGQVFASAPAEARPELVELSKQHLAKHELLGKASDKSPPIAFDLPEVYGSTLDEHFYKLGREASEPYLRFARDFATMTLPPRPRKWVQGTGWTKYVDGDPPVSVGDPGDEEMLVFDVEVLYKHSPFAVMACAASPKAWYAWLSPWLLSDTVSDRQLIPLGEPTKPRIVIGHNIGYDRARVKEEYNIQQTKNSFLDTMSLHVAVNGMCSRQRPTWVKHHKNREIRERMSKTANTEELSDMLKNEQFLEEEEELWVGRSSINNLRDVAKFHCDITIDKRVRDNFGILNRVEVMEKCDELLDYCAADVEISHKVYKSVLPKFLETCPHPVSFAALRHLSSVTLPVNKGWETYIADAEKKYQELSTGVTKKLEELANKALEMRDEALESNGRETLEGKIKEREEDLWLKQLDWTGQEIRMLKPKKTKKNEPPGKPRRDSRQKMPGKPNWYKGLFKKKGDPITLTVRTRIAPLLLRLSWDGHPLVWSNKFGWTFRVRKEDANKYRDSPVVRVNMGDEENEALRDDSSNVYFKLPHKDGPLKRCTNPLSKSYLQYFESGILSSTYDLAKEALEMNAACSYWISSRERIRSQMVIYESDTDLGVKVVQEEPNELGIILPQLIPMGTITRRAVESTWLTASNAKKNRVGSELKSLITAPPGYAFVGADVDSQELWIASLVGDAQFGIHGGNAIGFMTLEGSKAAGTDMHSRTGTILNISRNNAKIFNYGRIYGAGLKFASTLLRQFDPSIIDSEATKAAETLYAKTKGKKTINKLLSNREFWRGGTESFVFNKLEDFANQENPRTPVLGAGITEALMRRYISKSGFMTSRINWAIQSSGVDYLHLLIVSMDYLIRRYKLNARLAITVHDEIRYLVADEDKYRLALALQVSNLWTRAMFSQQMGINDVPQSCAWFSAVDIDQVLRKEVDLDCITPSQPNPIPPGESLNITELLNKGELSRLDINKGAEILLPDDYGSRTPVMATMISSAKPFETPEGKAFMKAQMATTDQEYKLILKELRSKIIHKKKEQVEHNEWDRPSVSLTSWDDFDRFNYNTGNPWKEDQMVRGKKSMSVRETKTASKPVRKTAGETTSVGSNMQLSLNIFD